MQELVKLCRFQLCVVQRRVCTKCYENLEKKAINSAVLVVEEKGTDRVQTTTERALGS